MKSTNLYSFAPMVATISSFNKHFMVSQGSVEIPFKRDVQNAHVENLCKTLHSYQMLSESVKFLLKIR